MLEQRIQQNFIDSADLKYQAAQTLSKPIADAVQAVLACVTSGGDTGDRAASAYVGGAPRALLGGASGTAHQSYAAQD